MEKRKFTREFWIGFLGILSLVIIYLLINFFKGISLFNEGSIYYVRFNDIGEIVKTSSVYVNGYKVGNVQEIEYDFEKGNGACVTLSLDKRLHIPVGSTAEINKELLSSSSISIIQGHSNSYLMPGDTLNGRLKSDAMEVAGEMLPAIGDMLPKIDSILISLNNTLANPSINNTLNNVEQLTAQLNSTSKDLDNLLNGDIATASSKLVALEDQMLELSTKLNEIEYQRIVASLETSLKNLEEITASLNNGEGTAGMLLKDSSLYIRLNETCESANALLEDLKEHPKRYVHFSIFGNKQK
ncbi:MAG: MCE family protein [Bacteroidaceae bacterium]|nr:MCE family protein [Bacteroidaceae bacterium]